jgi:hypothetical protein
VNVWSLIDKPPGRSGVDDGLCLDVHDDANIAGSKHDVRPTGWLRVGLDRYIRNGTQDASGFAI